MRWFLSLAAVLLCVPFATAQTAVVPSALNGVEGNSSYNMNGGFVATFQQLYSGSLLSSLPVGVQITGFQLRLDGGQPTGPSNAYSFTNYDVRIGTSLNGAGSLSATVADNFGPDTIVARTGALSFGVNSFPGGNSPNDFGPVISFDNPYIYNGGNLLLTVTHTAGGGSSIVWDGEFGGLAAGLAHYRQQNGVFDSPTTDSDFDGYALTVQFQYAAVPEPTTWAMLGVTAAGTALYLRRRRKQLNSKAAEKLRLAR